MKKVLIINGINTNLGGANVNTLKTWTTSILNQFSLTISHFNPNIYIRFSPKIVKAIYFLLFLPGSLFRIFKFPFFEIIYKISFIQILLFVFKTRPNKYYKVLLSHHSVLHLFAFVKKNKRVFIIHDLLYYRAKTMGYSKKIFKVLFRIEIYFYKKMDKILILSYDEFRILKKVVPELNIELISIIDFNRYIKNVNEIKVENKIALISDWRRSENYIDAIRFFDEIEKSNFTKDKNKEIIQISIYGYNSKSIYNSLVKSNRKSFKFLLMGDFKNYEEVLEQFILVPNFTGAGIKVKVLEAINQNKFVIGTKNAFFGLPAILINDIGLCIKKPDDIFNYLNNKNLTVKKNTFIDSYNFYFNKIENVI